MSVTREVGHVDQYYNMYIAVYKGDKGLKEWAFERADVQWVIG